MNILLIRSDVGLAGPAKLMHAYARAIRRAGHDVLVASGGGEYAIELEKDGFRHVTLDGLRIRSRNPFLAPISIARIAALLRREKITVVNSFNAHAGILAHLADPLRTAKHFNTVLGTGKEWANRLLANPILSGRIIAVSKDVRQRLAEAHVPLKRISVVYNSTLTERWLSEPPRRSKTSSIRICGIAMFTGNKGHEFIVPLVARLRERGHDVSATLVGDGPSRASCEQMAAELGVADHVAFTGALRDVVPSLDASDVFVHLPRTETFGIVLTEAMARSLPVVTVDVGGIPEVVRDGETAFVVKRREDADALVDAVERLIDNPDRRTMMGLAGRKRAEQMFALDTLRRDLEGTYSQS